MTRDIKGRRQRYGANGINFRRINAGQADKKKQRCCEIAGNLHLSAPHNLVVYSLHAAKELARVVSD
jgi:hypothetical protein